MERKLQYASIEEAFAALPADVQEHSLRVEKYTDLIFMEVCASDEYIMNMNSRVRLRYENRSMIGLAGRYHDIGKNLMPSVYHWQDDEFSPEETALYLRHTQGGDQLAKNTMRDQKGLAPMLIETVCEGVIAHHECWDGSGHPSGAKGEDIPIVGRIVAVADALDHLLMETRTETPIVTALDTLMDGSGTKYDPVIMGLLYEAKFKIERIFALYSSDSKAIPQSPHIIRRTKRPFWLKYRPILSTDKKHLKAVEADMVFRRGKEEVGFDEVEKMLKESKKVFDIQTCFVVEACDTVKRMRNCELGGKFIALNPVNGFWKKRGAASSVIKLLSDIDADPAFLCITIKSDDATAPSANVSENCAKLRAAGCPVMYRGAAIDEVDAEALSALGITHISLDVEKLERAGMYTAKLRSIEAKGIKVIAEGVDKHRYFATLTAAGIKYAFGDLMGEYETESEFITTELAAGIGK